ncbi:MAG: response regulator [Tannerella sp.]|nr:response regulator [Tannerella sp.]
MKSLLVIFAAVMCMAVGADEQNALIFKQISAAEGLHNNEVQKVFCDRGGFMWFATRYGLCRYSGYQMSIFKSDHNTPNLLTSNNIQCLIDDVSDNLWIGTYEGLNVYNRKTGEIRRCDYPNLGRKVISCMLVTRNNTLWIGSDEGLFVYNREKDEMELFAGERTGDQIGITTVKSLYEDSEGEIWIGTWSSGLYRYNPVRNIVYAYPRLNERNSAHVIYEDSRGNFWIGTWDCGLMLLENPKDMKRVTWQTFRHSDADPESISDNIIYAIYEDLNTETLWVGTRSALSIMPFGETGKFVNYTKKSAVHNIPFDEVNSIAGDFSGKIWIGTIGSGVFLTDTRKPKFGLHSFKPENESVQGTSVRSLLLDDDNCLWFGVGSYGLARHNRTTDSYEFYTDIPEFSNIKTSLPTIYAIIRRKTDGALWFGTYDGGIYVYRRGEKVQHLSTDNTDYIINSCVTAFYEDSKGNLWVGTRFGVGVQYADGKGKVFDNLYIDGLDLTRSYIHDIEEYDGCIWLSTTNSGIICIAGDTLRHYFAENEKINTDKILTLKRDSKGRLWAGAEGFGLFLHNPNTDKFDSKNADYKLPCDMVGCIEEDNSGALWLGTNSGLLQLRVSDDALTASMRSYTAADGLQGDFFIPRSSFSCDGELFFGGYDGYNSFFPDSINADASFAPLYITDIQILNRSLNAYDEKTRKKISDCTATYTEKITLPDRFNNFSIEFASLTYNNPELNKYSYMLEGFDHEWVFTNRNFAYYNNLKSGDYTFHLRATNENGVWNTQERTLKIRILPPLWATWWAFTGYLLLAVLVTMLIIRTAHNRMLLQNSLRLQKLEKDKAEEMNHAKLQFFTNITHELLTPLTIISATVDEMKAQEPKFMAQFPVITTNIQRLIRLLQQILEFRKAETGNLKLKVSCGDIAAFVRNAAETFKPLIKKRKLHFSVVCDPESITGFFDVDKLDKILYNLFSNAAKYNSEGGFIQVNVSYSDDKNFVEIAVRDNGKGIAPENQKNLFKRFYEGDYRKYNTIGTGIGLSLTQDLVKLHGGTIGCESEPDKGSLFVIRLPIDASHYKAEEIDNEVVHYFDGETSPDVAVSTVSDANAEVPSDDGAKSTLLVIEDNDDLLNLMVKLLSHDYRVLTASDGREGIEILEKEDVDLIVSDIMMPVMDGVEFCRSVKDNLDYCHIPVLLLTAKNTEEDRAEAYESGADGFISKPFNLAVLHARIKNLLKMKERTARDFKNRFVFELKDLNYTTLDEDFLQRCVDCVKSRLADPDFDSHSLVEAVGASRSTLHRKLKSLTGLNASGFISNIRLKAAVEIMSAKPGIRISELAYAVGFNDPKYFSSCFKKEFGMLPSDYADRYLK